MIDWKKELQRFDNDEYAAKYLAGVYNPEFKIYVHRPKDEPKLNNTGILLSWGPHTFKEGEHVC